VIGLDEARAGRLEAVAPRARRLLGRRDGHESANRRDSMAHESAMSSVGPPGVEDRKKIAKEVKRVVARTSAGKASDRVSDVEAESIAAELVAQATRVMEALEGGATDESVSGADAMALEAVIHVRGRPAVRVEGSGLEDLSVYPGAELWQLYVDVHERELIIVSNSTCAVHVRDRIAPQFSWIQGTAWLAAPDIAVTNRHVLFPPLGGTRLARRVPGTSAARLKTDLEITLDFTFDNGPKRIVTYSVIEVPFVSAERDPIDVAVLRVQPLDVADRAKPNPLQVCSAAFDIDHLYVVGHPGRMPSVPERVRAVFGSPDERKRVSFGQVMNGAAAGPGEVLHDASTIGGYSGGCVLGFLSREVRALHYFGDPVAGNRAITADALLRHPVGLFLPRS
jgi:hypothetical protein